MVITFCGHAQIKLGLSEIETIQNFLVEKIKACPNAKVYLGGYGNFDNAILHILKNLKKDFPEIELIFISPYLDYAYSKLKTAKDIYDSTIYPPLESVPKKFAISVRNKWMVDNSDILVAYVKNSWGGARQTLDYAICRKKSFVNFAK